jgi:protein-tyrosine phosphatase
MQPTLFRIANDSLGQLSTMTRPRGGDWLADEMAALRTAGVDILVSMLTVAELGELELMDEGAEARTAGLRFLQLPTPDRGIPPRQPFVALVNELAGELAAGRHVAVHCRAGIGRSSLVAAGVLIALGQTPAEAWAAISQARGLEVPDTPEQRQWLQSAMPLR